VQMLIAKMSGYIKVVLVAVIECFSQRTQETCVSASLIVEI